MNHTLRYLFFSFVFLCVISAPSFAQTKTVVGKVTLGTDGSPLPGVTIALKGTSNGTSSDASGDYRITVPERGAVLIFTSVGMNTQEVAVGSRSSLNIEMAEKTTDLTEVVVTGYNTSQRKDVIGSITTVSSTKFKDLPVSGFDQALQGQAAGVQVTQSSGTPGGGIAIRIRGNTSINASNRPLFIVDGVQIEDGSLSQRSFGGQNDNALALINPNDIESIQILKDASAKAIYGSRAANGVVLISTKKGKANARTAITLEAQRGVVDPTKRLDLLNASELLDLQREAVTNAGEDPDRLGLIKGVTDGVNTNWLDEIFRQGIYQQYQVSATGGNDKTRFYLSGNYRDEEGVQYNNRFTRYTGSLNIDHKASSQLSFGTNMILGRTLNMRVKGDNFLDGVYSGAIKSLPFNAPYNEQGALYGPGDENYAGFPNFNPVAQAVLPRFNAYTTKVLAGLYVEYAFLPDLKLRSKASIDYNGVVEDQFESSATAIGGFLPSVGGRGYGIYSSGTYATFTNTNTLTYNRKFGEKHTVSGLAGAEIISRLERTSSVQGRIFPKNDFAFSYIRSAGIVDQGDSFLDRNALLSFFGEIRYDYADKYLVTVTGRYDGSSRFGKNKQFGFFPSVSFGWRISEEPFLKDVNSIQDLKLRGSFGYVGNEQIGNFQFLGTFTSSGYTYNGATGLGPENLRNPNLQWERTREANVGIDASFWNGRLSTSLEAYDNLTDALLFAEPLPTTTGFGSVQGNIGQVSNRGLEFTLSTVNIDKDFKWRTEINVSHNRNMIKSLARNDTLFRGYTADGVGNTNVLMTGQPLGTFWGFKYQGVDVATGDALYEDANGDGRIDTKDGQVLGNAQPLLIGGITNRFSYKGFDLSVFFQFSYGNKMLNFTNTSLMNVGADIQSNQARAALRRWQKPGDVTDVPRYVSGATYNNFHSSRFIEDGSYLRLKNVSFGYNVPSKWLSRVKVSSARLFVSGLNLLTFTNYSGADPEVSTLDGSTSAQGIDFFTLPQVRTLTAGVTIGL